MAPKLFSLLLVFYLVLPGTLQAQKAKPTTGSTEYHISFPNAVHHEAEVKVTFRRSAKGPLHIRMARSSPGRYALHEFAKNIYNIRITDPQGKPLAYTHPNLHQWTVTDPGNVVFAYTLFGDRADGTYNQIDRTHAHLNMPASLAYALGLEDFPATVEFAIPEGSGWKVATQLKPETKANTYSAPNLQYLMDSPTELAPFTQHEWKVPGKGGKEQTFALALHHTGTEAEAGQFAEALKKIVREAEAVFGELPAFDYQRYTFIACYMPHASSDGMEHRNSCILTSPKSLHQHQTDLLATAAHEFFHAWNVERLRPKSLEPFRFDEANISSELWLAEGFTSYYSDLLMRRAGLYTDEAFIGNLQADINAYMLSPAAQQYSPVHMSEMAPFVDATRHVDPVNWQNTYLSYYTYGAVVAAYLDLTLRSRFQNLSLDDLMFALWQKHGRTETPYTNADVQATLSKITADKKFAETFFANHIYGHAPMDFYPLLARAGLAFLNNTSKGTLGQASLSAEETGLRVSAPTVLNSALYRAGLNQGDLIVEVEGKKATEKNLAAALRKKKAGDQLAIVYLQRGQKQAANITLVTEPGFSIRPIGIESPDKQQKISFRQQWLDSKAK